MAKSSVGSDDGGIGTNDMAERSESGVKPTVGSDDGGIGTNDSMTRLEAEESSVGSD